MIRKIYNRIVNLSPAVVLVIGLAFMLSGFFFQTDLGYDDAPIATSYSLSLGANCESDYKQCHVRPRVVVGYRIETTRNEVVAFMPGMDGLMDKYNECTIWSASDWQCEAGRISMHDGLITHNEFETDHDIYYVPKIAWKMAKLHILPLNSVRHSPPPKSVHGT